MASPPWLGCTLTCTLTAAWVVAFLVAGCWPIGVQGAQVAKAAATLANSLHGAASWRFNPLNKSQPVYPPCITSPALTLAPGKAPLASSFCSRPQGVLPLARGTASSGCLTQPSRCALQAVPGSGRALQALQGLLCCPQFENHARLVAWLMAWLTANGCGRAWAGARHMTARFLHVRGAPPLAAAPPPRPSGVLTLID